MMVSLALCLPAIALAAFVARRVIRRWMLGYFTSVLDLKLLGSPRKGGKIQGSAVICGGSVSGLLAARVLSTHFTRVIIIEPEEWALSENASEIADFGTRQLTNDDGTTFRTIAHKRSRVYQYTAVHGFQVLLTLVLRALFPTFDKVAKDRDILLQNSDVGFRFSGWGFRPPYKEYGGKLPDMLFASRRNFEALLCTLVRSTCPSIEYIQGTATAFILASDSTRIDAVRVRQGDTERNIACVLALDCTGASQAGLKLLQRCLPQHSTVLMNLRENYNPQINYSTIELPFPAGFEEALAQLRVDRGLHGPEWEGPTEAAPMGWWITHMPDPDVDYRTLFACRYKETIVFAAGGWASELPHTLEQLREYANGAQSDFPVPQLFFDILDLCEPVKNEATVSLAHITSCSRIMYEKAADILPRNFVALGDSVMRLNPRFGEGVSKVSLCIATLDRVLRQHNGPNIGPYFFATLAPRAQGFWDVSRVTDYGRSTTTPVPGERFNGGLNYA